MKWVQADVGATDSERPRTHTHIHRLTHTYRHTHWLVILTMLSSVWHKRMPGRLWFASYLLLCQLCPALSPSLSPSSLSICITCACSRHVFNDRTKSGKDRESCANAHANFDRHTRAVYVIFMNVSPTFKQRQLQHSHALLFDNLPRTPPPPPL